MRKATKIGFIAVFCAAVKAAVPGINDKRRGRRILQNCPQHRSAG